MSRRLSVARATHEARGLTATPICSADAGKAAKDIKLEHNVLVMCVSADSRWLFVASEDKTAAVYSTSTWSEVKRCSAPKKVCWTLTCRIDC